MKAISFLQYYNYFNEPDMSMQDFIWFMNKYYKKVSQLFSFEKVVELFEKFELFKQHGRTRLILKNEDIAFEIDEDSHFVIVINFNNFYRKTLTFLWERCTNDVIPKTIDEFIVLCKNLNINLTWKQ